MSPSYCTASSMLAVAARRLRTLPRLRDWVEALILLGITGALAFVIANWSQTLSWDASLPGVSGEVGGFLILAAVAVVVPCLFEEMVFRSALQPERLVGWRSFSVSALSLAIFVLWHPVQVWTGWFTGQAVFLDAGFLLVAAVLGLACTISVHRSGSIWGAVVIHWGLVLTWKAGT